MRKDVRAGAGWVRAGCGRRVPPVAVRKGGGVGREQGRPAGNAPDAPALRSPAAPVPPELVFSLPRFSLPLVTTPAPPAPSLPGGVAGPAPPIGRGAERPFERRPPQGGGSALSSPATPRLGLRAGGATHPGLKGRGAGWDGRGGEGGLSSARQEEPLPFLEGSAVQAPNRGLPRARALRFEDGTVIASGYRSCSLHAESVS